MLSFIWNNNRMLCLFYQTESVKYLLEQYTEQYIDRQINEISVYSDCWMKCLQPFFNYKRFVSRSLNYRWLN